MKQGWGRRSGLTHGYTQQTHADLNTGDGCEDMFRLGEHEPIVGEVCQEEAEHVLEDEEAGEGFDGDLAWRCVYVNMPLGKEGGNECCY